MMVTRPASIRFAGDKDGAKPVRKPVIVRVLKQMSLFDRGQVALRMLSNRLSHFPNLNHETTLQRIVDKAKPVKCDSLAVVAAEVHYGGHRYVFEKWPSPTPFKTFYRIHELDNKGQTKSRLFLPGDECRVELTYPLLDFDHNLTAQYSTEAGKLINTLRRHLNKLDRAGLFDKGQPRKPAKPILPEGLE